MGLFDKNKESEKDKIIIDLQNQIIELNKTLHPDVLTLNNLKQEQIKISESLKKQRQTYEHNKTVVDNLIKQIKEKENILNQLQKDIVKTQEECIMQSFGIYIPQYKLMLSDDYKKEMLQIRDTEKKYIKDEKATTSISNWTINGSAKEGTKMVKDTVKLLLRNFNLECDDIIDKINSSNYTQSLERIQKSADTISKLGSIMKISITNDYINLKKKEAVCAFNYALAKEAEREELQRIREEERERQKVEKEIAEQKKKMDKEQKHFEQALKDLQKEIEKAKEDKALLEELLEKQKELNKSLTKVKEEKNSVNFREAHPKAGYVYIISNIGSFGENMYKIGCTKRLDPQDRVDELGDASVPFKFDVHAFIFSNDAFALESALHKAFEDRKVNLENSKKEFFYVTLDEIKEVVKKNFDKTVEFTDIAEAAQYRASLKIREMMKQGIKFNFDNEEVNINEA